jgi:hypothetical protein
MEEAAHVDTIGDGTGNLLETRSPNVSAQNAT